MLSSYKDLKVWQKSIDLVLELYKITNLFPKSEIYGLVSQMRRSAVSIPSNIAEGYSRKHRQEYAQFIRVVFASGAELETQIIISKELKFVSEKEFNRLEILLVEVMKMLNGLNSALLTKP